MYIYKYIYTYMYKYIYIYIHIYIYIYVYMNNYIYMYVNAYIYIIVIYGHVRECIFRFECVDPVMINRRFIFPLLISTKMTNITLAMNALVFSEWTQRQTEDITCMHIICITHMRVYMCIDR